MKTLFLLLLSFSLSAQSLDEDTAELVTPIWHNLQYSNPPEKAGEYLVYHKDWDTMTVTYWNGEKWGYKGKEDTRVSHWAVRPGMPGD